MADRRIPRTPKEYRERYQEQRVLLWKGFCQQLDRLHDVYGVAVVDLAEGLGISRQKFYDFKSAPEKGLPIDRVDLIALWGWLTDPDVLKDKRMSAEAKAKREELREKGPNSLLKSAGFLPISANQASDNLLKTSLKDSSLKRVEARLSSLWIEDGVRRSQIIDILLDEVKTRGRLDQELHTVPISAVEALTWITKPPLNVSDRDLIQVYQQKIYGLTMSGKNQFVGVELFELYQNLLEYQSIDSYTGAKLDIIDCQFPILSAQLPVSVQRAFDVFRATYRQAETNLLRLLSDLAETESNRTGFTSNTWAPATPVIRALIKSKIEGFEKPIVWRYSSTGTHLENMLSAITCGLGHPLERTGFSIQATGATSRSLARVSIGLAERDDNGKLGKVYQGWWVDSNAITAVLVATVIATKDWLSSNGADLTTYLKICHQLGDIDNRLYLIRENVQEYFFRAASGPVQDVAEISNDDVFKDIEAQIADIESLLPAEKQPDSCYRTRYQALENRRIKTKLAHMRLALKNSSVRKARQELEDAKDFLSWYEDNDIADATDESEEDAYRHVLFLQASECVMLHNFYAGDREFLNGKLWRYRPRYGCGSGLKKLKKYIKFIGTLNFDTFSAASQLYGVVGLLELYMAEEKDSEPLKKATRYLLWAAYYSQRIGYVRRASYWLTHASRVYCRLGELEKSERLSQVAQVTADAAHQEYQEESDYDSKFKSFITANTYLAEGERSLVKHEPQRALSSFLKALHIFVDLHSADRLTADVLYGLYRVTHDPDIEGEVGNAFTELPSSGKHTQLDEGMFEVLEDIIRCLKEINPKSQWSDVSPLLKELAKKIWHYWAKVDDETSDKHPIEEAIERDRFLRPVINPMG